MRQSLIQIYAILLFISSKHDKLILYELFNDYCKKEMSRNHFIMIHILFSCYKKNSICAEYPIFKILDYLVVNRAPYLCKCLFNKIMG